MRDPRFWNNVVWWRSNVAQPDEVEMARASARTLADCAADVKALERAREDVASGRAGVWQAFHEAFARAVRANVATGPAWAEAIEGRVVREHIAIFVREEAGTWKGPAELWRRELDPCRVWNRSRDLQVSLDDLEYWSELLLRVRPARAVALLESTRIPAVMVALLHRAAGEDRAMIETLMEVAPRVFDADGAWAEGRPVVALLASSLVVDHVRRLRAVLTRPAGLHGEPLDAEQLSAIFEVELTGWMTSTFAKILAREDGLWICAALQQHVASGELLRHRSPNPHVAPDPWNVDAVSMRALAHALEDAGATISDAHSAWKITEELAARRFDHDRALGRVRQDSWTDGVLGDEEGARTLHAEGFPRLLAAACLPAIAVDDVARRRWWGWFGELAIGRDPGLALLYPGNGLARVPQTIGGVLATSPDALDLLRDLYARLEPQRRRNGFHLSRDLESVIVLRVGCSVAVNVFAAGDERRAASVGLFRWLYEQAIRLWLTARDDTGITRDAVTGFFAYLATLFPAGLSDELSRMLPPVASDPLAVAFAAANLCANGASALDAATLFSSAGVDLDDALRAAHQWADLTELEGEFPPAARELAAQRGLALAAVSRRRR